MEPFKDDDAFLIKSEAFAFEDTLTFLKRIGREFDLFAFEQVAHLLAEIGEVKGVDVLEVPVAVFISRGVHSVDKVVIHGDDNGLDAIDEQLYLQAFGEGCFARGGGS